MSLFKIASSTVGLGDTLFLTAIAKYFPNKLTVQLPLAQKRFECLFEGLAQVELTNDRVILNDVGAPAHYTTMKLRNFFGDVADGMDNRPLVLYSDPGSEAWAQRYLKDKPNPVIFVPTCSPEWKDVRSLPGDLPLELYNDLLARGATPIVCQSSKNFWDYGRHQLTDIDLRRYICLLRRVGRYVGCNTGDEHLAVATGCQTLCYQPEDHDLFQGWQWNYNHPNHQYVRWNLKA